MTGPLLRLAGAMALAGLAACTAMPGQDVLRNPDTASRLHVAQVAEASGQNETALALYRVAAENDPSNVVAQSHYSGSLAQAGQFAIAEQVLAQAMKRHPDDPVLIVAAGRLKVQEGKAEEALPLFGRVLAGNPAHVEALIGRGVALDLLNRSAEAQASYRTAQAADPYNVAATNDLGLSLLLSGQVAEARRVLGSLAQRSDAPQRAINNLGIAQAVGGDRGAAMGTLGGRIGPDALETIERGFGVAPAERRTSRQSPS